MTTLYYQWGVATGGVDPSTGLPPAVVVTGGGVSGPGEQFAGTLGAGVTTITFSRSTNGVAIRNTSDTSALEYSFDNATWFTCIAYQVVQEGVKTDAVYLRAVSGTPTYEVLGILNSLTP